MKRLLVLVLVALCASVTVMAQDKPDPPSSEELLELADKAQEKTDAYRVAIVAAKQDLPANEYQQYMSAVGPANEIIKGLRQSKSAYATVALVTILDDMTLNASRAELQLMTHLADASEVIRTRVMLEGATIGTAESGCYDISELTMHAALRYVGFEETSLNEVVSKFQKMTANQKH